MRSYFRRSTTNVTTAVVGDVEARVLEHVVGFLTMDVKAAFNKIQKKNLIQAAPSMLANTPGHYGYFVHDRNGQRRLCLRERSPRAAILYGLPQGFPVSPILFLPFMASLLQNTEDFGYIDDCGFLCNAPSLEACRTSLAVSSVRLGHKQQRHL